MLGSLLPWLGLASNSDASFDDMIAFLTSHNVLHPPCRTTLAKWLDGQIIFSRATSVFDGADSSKDDEGDDDTGSRRQASNTTFFIYADQQSSQFLRDTYSINDIGNVVFVA